MRSNGSVTCDRCGNGTYREPDKTGKRICAKCKDNLELLKADIKDYLIELGLPTNGLGDD